MLHLILLFFLALSIPANAKQIDIVALGDSNTAGFGVNKSDSYPAQLERKLRSRGHNVSVHNLGRNGDTSSGGAQRINSVTPDTEIAIVFFGRNDRKILRPVESIAKNIDSIVSNLKTKGIEVVLIGFYPIDLSLVARKYNVIYYANFFEGVANGDSKYKQFVLSWDPVRHFNKEGYNEITNRLLPYIEKAIARVTTSGY